MFLLLLFMTINSFSTCVSFKFVEILREMREIIKHKYTNKRAIKERALFYPQSANC